MQINDKKKFNGKVYRLIKSSNKKSVVKGYKNDHKKSGWLVRMTKEEGMWRLWRRSEKTLHPPKYLTTPVGNWTYAGRYTIKTEREKKKNSLHNQGYDTRQDTWTNDDTNKKYYTLYKRSSTTRRAAVKRLHK